MLPETLSPNSAHWLSGWETDVVAVADVVM